MKVGVLGSGIVGRTLAAKFAELGHEVQVGTRDPAKLGDWIKETRGQVEAAGNADVAAWADLGVIATGWIGTENAIALAGPENFAGKVVIDVTNPLDLSSGSPVLAVGHTTSAGELIQEWIPEGRVVKAFNIVTAATMVNPAQTGGEPDMFIAGNDEDAKKSVTEILYSFGWKGVIDLGDIALARYLEPLAMIWVAYAQRTGTFTHAFKLVGT
jgi:8-hydroxy-5-deazaflavin:NADPH oxidoreductase